MHRTVMVRETLERSRRARLAASTPTRRRAAEGTARRCWRRARPTGACSRRSRPGSGRGGRCAPARGFGERAVVQHSPTCEIRSGWPSQASRRGRLSPTSASARRSSTAPSAASRSAQRARSTCAWTRARGETAGRAARSALDERELADIIYQYGEERRSRPIARSHQVRARRAKASSRTTERPAPRGAARAAARSAAAIDPATRTFQALRIAVNRELEQLESAARRVPELLEDEGVAAMISFHSLEDRLVKHAFRDDARLRR